MVTGQTHCLQNPHCLKGTSAVCSATEWALTLCDPVDCSLLDSCPGDAPGKNNGVGCQALLQGISHTQASTRFSLIGRQILPCLSHQGSS